MSTEHNKALVRRFFEEVYNANRLDLCDELFAPEFGAEGGLRGPDRARRAVTHLRSAFPDLHFTVLDVVGEGAQVVIHVRLQGTHQGEFMGLPPSGKPIDVEGAELAVVRDGKIIAEGWHLYDIHTLMRQISVTG